MSQNKIIALGIVAAVGIGAYFFLKDKEIFAVARQGENKSSGGDTSGIYTPQFEETPETFDLDNSDSSDDSTADNPLLPTTNNETLFSGNVENSNYTLSSGGSNYSVVNNSSKSIPNVVNVDKKGNVSLGAPLITSKEASNKTSPAPKSSSGGSKVGNAIRNIVKASPIKSIIKIFGNKK